MSRAKCTDPAILADRRRNKAMNDRISRTRRRFAKLRADLDRLIASEASLRADFAAHDAWIADWDARHPELATKAQAD